MAAVRRLVGVGLGPGDPELLTCKAVRVLGEADLVVVSEPYPETDGPGRATAAVTAHLPQGRIEVVRPPVGIGREERDEALFEATVEVVRQAYQTGASTVAVATLGDPSVYCPFRQLADAILTGTQAPDHPHGDDTEETHAMDATDVTTGADVTTMDVTTATDAESGTARRREADGVDVEVEVVPGITAMQALAAAGRTPLVEGTESLTLVPATAGLASFTDALEHSDTVVAYRGGRYLAAMRGELGRHGRLTDAILGEQVGLEDERVTRLADLDDTSRTELSMTVIVPAARCGAGS